MSEPEAGAIRHHSDTVHIAAPPEKIWEMVTAMDRYGEWSSENTGGYWRKRENGDVCTGEIGDMFVGINKLDGQEWKAPVEIVERDDNKTFAFVTGGLEYNIALWKYELEPADGGTNVTESWTLRTLSPNMIEHGEAEIDLRQGNAQASIKATLANMKAAAEG